MRHRVYGKKIGRSKNQRTTLFKNLVRSLILSEKIQTTEAKAKAIKGMVDKIILQAKNPQTRRLVTQFLSKQQITDKLVNEIVPSLGDRKSGFTSMVRLGRRLGDGAMVVQINLLLEKPIKDIRKKEKPKKKETKKEGITK